MVSKKKKTEESASLQIVQDEKYEGDNWWAWSGWLDGPPDVLDEVQYVEYTLHPTFADPVRKVSDRRSKFKLATGGWGVFPIYARVVTKDGRSRRLRHQLKLHYEKGKLNTD